MKKHFKELRQYLLLWSTQSLSALGSGMTGYALTLWLYQETGSALKTALLQICTYAPYVLMSIFAGALSDRWNKKRIILGCDLFAAMSTVAVLLLALNGRLEGRHLYLINAVNGLMNTIQRPASDVAATLLIPKEEYQRTSGLRSFSDSLTSILTPVFATAFFAFGGLGAVIAFDLTTFAAAFLTLSVFIKIPEPETERKSGTSLLKSAGEGLVWLKSKPAVLYLILFLSGINLVASAHKAVLPAMILSVPNGGKAVLGMVNAAVGAATLTGSIIVTVLRRPKDRIRTIRLSLLLSMSTENFILAFGKTPLLWCIGAVCGWIAIPCMGANLDVILRTEIPPDMQGRVFSCRNTLQFFTIPLGYCLGGALTDSVFEPYMRGKTGSLLNVWFGSGKGSGAAMLLAVLGLSGVAVCAVFGVLLRGYKWSEAEEHNIEEKT
ncbi:MAG: MFS transporter [Oscillospiraceae bacterium]|nr:MFS transporter [Oscillospiraceae bacterium]